MPPPKSYKVLVVEDEGLIAQDIAGRLRALGHQAIAIASTADEAVAHAPGADLVLMDIHIDGPRDGIDAAHEIRARYRIPVVFLSAHADRVTVERIKSATPYGYIVKPLGPGSLQIPIELAIHRHAMDRQLEEREAWLSAPLSSAAEAIVAVDPAGSVRSLNRAAERLTGWSNADAQGRCLKDVLHLVGEVSGQDAEDPIPLAILTGEPVPLEPALCLVSRDGREHAVEGVVAPILSPAGSLGLVLTLRDATERRWEERQLRQAQRMEAVARFAAGVSGEYAGLLETIRAHSTRLLQQLSEFSSAREALEKIDQAAISAHRITQRLAGFGGRQVAQPEILSPNAMLRRMARLIESTAGANIAATVRPDPSSGRVRADVDQVEQAVMNLVLRACAAMPQGGKLVIETHRVEAPAQRRGICAGYLAIAVEYSATEPDLENLFDPAGASEGGLALPEAHAIATEHGGYLSARATPGGTRIELLLPRIQEESFTAAQPALTAETPTILLVDPRDRVRAQLHNFFESAGYNLIEASDCAEAIALGEMHEGRLDLLIAERADAQAIQASVASFHPATQRLAVVDGPATSPCEIQRPFTQQALLQRVESLLTAATSSSRVVSLAAS